MLSFINFTSLNESFDYIEAHRIAQLNASKPVKEGGLGLPSNNTSLDRAKAMGFTLKAYHGTGSDIHEFIKNKAHDKEGRSFGLGLGKSKFYFSTDPDVANNWADNAPTRGNFQKKLTGDKYGSGLHPNVMPVLIRVKKEFPEEGFIDKLHSHPDNKYDHDKAVRDVDKEMKSNKVNVIRGEHQVAVYNSNDIRSIHAAFDPMKDSSNLLENFFFN